MKRIFTLAIVTLSAVFSLGQSRNVSLSEFFSEVSSNYLNQDVDFYSASILAGDTINKCDPVIIANSDQWLLFVDEAPMANWSHPCTLYQCPKVVDGNTLPIEVTHLSNVPNGIMFSDYQVADRFSNLDDTKPHVQIPLMYQNGGNNPFAENIHAVIISGGINQSSNNSRYWNDCSFIYQTLRNRYGIPKSNISLLMADGDDPAIDMRSGQSSPLDLDFDGSDDLELAATRSNVMNTLASLSSQLTENDNLFVFVTDHGGLVNSSLEPYICLWNYERLYASELGDILDAFNVKTITVLLEQCYSGGFVDYIQGDNRIIMTAASLESSYASNTINYDEFCYHWTCAINGEDIYGNDIEADTDNDGYVSMKEAFDYAVLNDDRTETPQYSSSPTLAGEHVAFNNIPNATMKIRDYLGGTIMGSSYIASPDVYIRNNPDGFVNHQNEPINIEPRCPSPLYGYVRITNDGPINYHGVGKYVTLYWYGKPLTTVGIGASPVNGAGIETKSLTTAMTMGSTTIVEFMFDLPSFLLNKLLDSNSGCVTAAFLAVVTDTIPHTDIHGEIPYPYRYRFSENILSDINAAAINTIVAVVNSRQETSVSLDFSNPDTTTQNYDIEFVSDGENDVFEDIDVSITISDQQHETSSEMALNHLNNKLRSVQIASGEICSMDLSLKAKSPIPSEKAYALRVIKKDHQTGETIEGYTIDMKGDAEESSIRELPFIQNLNYSNNKLEVTLSEPTTSQVSALATFVGMTTESYTVQFLPGSETTVIDIPEGNYDFIVVSLLIEGKSVASKKLMVTSSR